MFAPYIINVPSKRAPSTTGSACSGCRSPPGPCRRTSSRSRRSSRRVLLPILGAVADRTANKKGLLAGFAWVGAALRVAAVLLQGRQLGDRRGRRDRRQPVPGRLDGLQRLDPAADLRRGRARPGLLPGLGLGLPRRRPPAGRQPRPVPRPRQLRPDRGPRGADQHAVRRDLVGGVHDHPVPPAAQPRARCTWCPSRAACWRRASASSARPSGTCATTRWRSPSCSPTSSSTTASRP